MSYILGIDNGLTVSKAVIFSETGEAVSVARRRVPQIMPQPRHVERDMNELWDATAGAIREAVDKAGCSATDIKAVAATAHGDGIYLVDETGKPLRNGILSLDSRAGEIIDQWEKDGTSALALKQTGQVPHASAPSALLDWIKRYEPDVFGRIGTILACKDWLRYCLTGVLGTDLTEASTSFTDVKTQQFRDDNLAIYGLGALTHALPDVNQPHEIVGQVTPDAAGLCGLAAGTPVVAGLHDVTASALGVGGYGEGVVAIVAGTYSINETVSPAPKTDARWFCRNGIVPGEWNNMSISPASAANYDWFLDTFLASERAEFGDDIHTFVSGEIDAIADRRSSILFHPYLFGSPHGPIASAGFLGLRGWHGKAETMRALIEGIAFNHRLHVDALGSAFSLSGARLTGGISRNPTYCQIFADALGLPVMTVSVDEAAAWGAALCAGAGIGMFDNPRADPGQQFTGGRTFAPQARRSAELNELYQLHCEASDALSVVWRKLDHYSNEQPLRE